MVMPVMFFVLMIIMLCICHCEPNQESSTPVYSDLIFNLIFDQKKKNIVEFNFRISKSKKDID